MRRVTARRLTTRSATTAQLWLALSCAAQLSLLDCGNGVAQLELPRFQAGADLSFLDELEQRGAVFRDDTGAPRDALLVLRDHGLTAVRLRLWNAPAAGFCSLARTLPMAARVRAAGLALLLDLHYSDHWADPGNQTPPAAWAQLRGVGLESAVHDFTRDAVAALAAQGTPPQLVQLGNEITSGFLWDAGRVGGAFDNLAQWTELAGLLAAASKGVHDGIGSAPAPRLLIHIDRGGDNTGARWFFDSLVAQGVQFDAIGLSYYPWWHGSVSDFAANANDLAARYQRDLYLVETAYPWTLANGDAEPNFVSQASQLEPGYDATPAGQRAFLAAVVAAVHAIPNGHGMGLFYWAPDWLATPGMSEANPWDNQTLFTPSGLPLPAMSALH